MISGGLSTKGVTKTGTKEHPLITIVTVVYNGEKTIEQTILSVINQTYDNIEYIIIDGNSTDRTLDIIKKYEDKIDYWQSEPDDGIYYAMNKGVKLARGNYIVMLNSDDWFESDACSIIANEIKQKEYDVYHAIANVIDANNNIINVYAGTIYTLNTQCLAHGTCFIKKSIYDKYLYDTKYKSAADYDFILKIHRDGYSFKFIDKIILNFRTGGMSYSNLSALETIAIHLKYKHYSKFIYFLHFIWLKLFKRPF